MSIVNQTSADKRLISPNRTMLFFENWAECIAQIPWGLKISTKSLYLQRLRRQKQFCVFALFQKIRKFKMAAIFEKVFQKWVQWTLQITWGSKISTKSLYLQRLRRQKQFGVFALFQGKFKMAAIFENFFKSGYSVFLRYPGGRKFRQNHSISNG